MRKNMLTETIRTYATSLKDSLLQLRQSGPKKGVEINYIYYFGIVFAINKVQEHSGITLHFS